MFANGSRFQVKYVAEAGTVSLITPENGPCTYKYDDTYAQWVDVKDGHFFVELFMRDMLPVCAGYPKL